MSNFSNYLEQKLLGHTLLGSTFTAPTTVYLSLATSSASDGDIFEEVPVATGYARIPIDFSEPTSPNDWTSVNSADVTFSAATTPWGLITFFGVHDADAAGNMLYWGAMDNDRDIQVDDVLEFQAGNLSVRLD